MYTGNMKATKCRGGDCCSLEPWMDIWCHHSGLYPISLISWVLQALRWVTSLHEGAMWLRCWGRCPHSQWSPLSRCLLLAHPLWIGGHIAKVGSGNTSVCVCIFMFVYVCVCVGGGGGGGRKKWWNFLILRLEQDQQPDCHLIFYGFWLEM